MLEDRGTLMITKWGYDKQDIQGVNHTGSGLLTSAKRAHVGRASV